MLKINSTTYLQLGGYEDSSMIWAGWEAKRYWFFVVYSKPLIK